MGNFNQSETDYQNVGGWGGGMFGGSWLLIAVIVLWFLFRDGHRGFDGHRDSGHCGYGYAHGGCNPITAGVRSVYHDESNYEQDRYLCSKFDKEYEAIRCEGEKTRTLIENNYIQDLRDKLAAKNAEVLTLKSEAFTKAEIGGVMAAISKTNHDIERLSCETLKRPPVWGEARIPCSSGVKSCCDHERKEVIVRRGRCDFDEGF